VNAVPTWVLGTGGQARETADLIRAAGCDRSGQVLHVAGMVGPAEESALLARGGAVVLGLGFPRVRAEVYQRFADAGRFTFPTVIHPRADIGPSSELEEGVVVSSGCVITTDVHLGAGTLFNPRAGAGHDTALGPCCVVNPGANLSGSVTIGAAVLVGSGATVLQGITIGDRAVIGAGAVVTHDVPADVTVVGVPARPITAAEAR
jgi:sugar O-acyltransferase (sialic acid O-acetyltransferase NeuD family)